MPIPDSPTLRSAYDDVLEQARRLSREEQLRLLADLATLLRQRASPRVPQHSILELQGLGKEIWRGIDAQEYVDRERDTWDG